MSSLFGRPELLCVLLALHYALLSAAVTPTAPGPGDVFKAGGDCVIQWDVDETGSCKNLSIDLMSGPNNKMVVVTNVAQGLHGCNSSVSPYTWTCPEVDPYSAIYFYQFSLGGDSTASQWTTRFTIASASGDSDSPEQAQQPDGKDIPWGNGHLSNDNATSSVASSTDTPHDSVSDSPTASATGMIRCHVFSIMIV
ncbi:hypothetical protein BV25DRAFT_29762 [Artomyces pyxidatus]|uniref:Uncharacterized protein n=1 Tax=Artomyces pyxidatus TaxID=48021 RepID=A0ACB8TJW0_9AGAM|nr:hypothetical protein BV25DRAFT_29762 [Artomyces pyxidatus]